MALDDFDSSNIPPALNQPGDVDPDTGAVDSNGIVSRMATQGMQDFDKTWVQRPQKQPDQQPDLTQYGKTKEEIDAEPQVDLTQYGEEEPQKKPEDADLGFTGNVKAGVKAAAQSAVSGAGSVMQGAAVSMGRTTPANSLQAPGDEVISPFDQGPDADKPVLSPQDNPIYKAGKSVKELAQKIPLTDAERNSIGGEVGSAVGGGAVAMGAAFGGTALGGPIVGIGAGMAAAGLQGAGDTYEAAKAKGVDDDTALNAAGISGAVNGAMMGIPVGAVLTPIKRLGPGITGWALGKLAQFGVNGGVFTTIGEAQHYIDTQIAHAYYDPDAKYDPSLKRAMGEFLAGGMFGVLHPLRGDEAAAAQPQAQPQPNAGAQPGGGEAGAQPGTGPGPQPNQGGGGAASGRPYGNPHQTDSYDPNYQWGTGGAQSGTWYRTDPQGNRWYYNPSSADWEQPGAQGAQQGPQGGARQQNQQQNKASGGAQQQGAMPRGAQWDQTWQTTAAPAADEQSGKRWQTLAKMMQGQYGFASSDLKNASFADLARFMAGADALQANGISRDAIRKMTPADMAQAMSDVRAGASPQGEQDGGAAPGTRSNPINLQTVADLDRVVGVVNEAHTGPQGEANNIQRGHAVWNDMPVLVETGSNNVRRGTVPETGETWEQKTGLPYGSFKGIKGADGDDLDVFIGPHLQSPTVYILDENDQKTGKFKQHKVLIGLQTPAQAYEAYITSSGKAPSQVRGISAMSVDEFKKWTSDPKNLTKPLSPEPAPAAQPNPKNAGDQQPGGMAADTPSAEPVSDILAQARDLKDPKSRRAALWLPAETVEHLGRMGKLDDAIVGPALHDFDKRGGILVTRDLKTAGLARDERKAGRPVQEIVGRLIGSGNGKPADATQVVQQLDEQGNVTRERAVRENEARKVYQAFSQPGRTVRIVTPEDAVARRAELVAKEAGKPQAEPAHATHDDARAVAEALAAAGIDPAAVRPVDIMRAAEIARENGISPEEAFPVAVLRSLVEDGHIKPEDVEKVLGNDRAKAVLESVGGTGDGRQPRAQEAGAAVGGQAAVPTRGIAESGAASGARAGQGAEAASAEHGGAGGEVGPAGAEADGGVGGVPAAGHQEGGRDDVHAAGGERDAEHDGERGVVGKRDDEREAADSKDAASSKGVRRYHKPLSLLEFIGKLGGLKPTPEWASMGLDHRSKVVVPVQGYRSLIKRDGMSMDDLVEKLRESGFVERDPDGRPGDAGVYNAVYDLVDKELRGKKQYPIGSEHPTAVYDDQQAEHDAEIEEQRQNLHKALDEAGIPLHSLTPGLEERTVALMHAKWTQGELFDPLDLMEAAALSLERDHDEQTDAEYGETGVGGDALNALDEIAAPEARGATAPEGEQAGRLGGLQQAEVLAEPGEGARGNGEGPRPAPEAAATERTEAGEQHVLPGAERIGEAEQAQRGADEKLKAATAQKPADEGLFGDTAAQTDLVDMARAGEREKVSLDDLRNEAAEYPSAGNFGLVANRKYGLSSEKATEIWNEAHAESHAEDEARTPGEADVDAADSDESVHVSLTDKGPWDFNDTWPTPNREKVKALEEQGREAVDPDDAAGTSSVLDETLYSMMSDFATMREVGKKLIDARAGKGKPPKRMSREEWIKSFEKEIGQAKQAFNDTAATLLDQWDEPAVSAIKQEARKRVLQERYESPTSKAKTEEAQPVDEARERASDVIGGANDAAEQALKKHKANSPEYLDAAKDAVVARHASFVTGAAKKVADAIRSNANDKELYDIVAAANDFKTISSAGFPGGSSETRGGKLTFRIGNTPDGKFGKPITLTPKDIAERVRRLFGDNAVPPENAKAPEGAEAAASSSGAPETGPSDSWQQAKPASVEAETKPRFAIDSVSSRRTQGNETTFGKYKGYASTNEGGRLSVDAYGDTAAEAQKAAKDRLTREFAERAAKREQENAPTRTVAGDLFGDEPSVQTQPGPTGELFGDDEPRESEKVGMLEDAGEKIGGARKDQWIGRGLDAADLEGMTGAEKATHVTKANVWARPDYAQAVEDGVDPTALAIIKQIYDRIPAKWSIPNHSGWDEEKSQQTYLDAVKAVRDVLADAKTKDDIGDASRKWHDLAKETDPRGGGANTWRRVFARGKRSYYEDPFRDLYALGKRAEKMVEAGFPEQEPWTRFYSIEDSAKWEGGKIAGREYIAYRKGGGRVGKFGTRDEAVEAVKKHYEENKGKIKDGQELPSRPHLDSVERTGPDYREGKNVGSEDFIKAFGFRGVEFGNYVASDERQRNVNMAYDALMDLARVLNVPPKALSLDGKLGIAFGARGHGGRAAAHYEAGSVVMNLTKMSGAGSLAHEFTHALDHYLGEIATATSYGGAPKWASLYRAKVNPNTFRNRVVNSNLGHRLQHEVNHLMHLLHYRQETVAEAEKRLSAEIDGAESSIRSWKNHLETAREHIRKKENTRFWNGQLTKGDQALRWWNEKRASIAAAIEGGAGRKTVETEFYKNAQNLGEYWSRPLEMLARATESYVADKIDREGNKSQYLVHGVEANRFGNGFRGNPYPAGDERAAINAQFDRVFRAIEAGEGKLGKGSKLQAAAGDIEPVTVAAPVRTPTPGPELADEQREQADAIDEASTATLAGAFAVHFIDGKGFPTILQARKFAKDAGHSEDAKSVEEALEQAVVATARATVKTGGDPKRIYNDLVNLYGQQPKLGTRTSTSVREQAYSTPVPLAFIASRLAGIEPDLHVYEPTAGNGALLIEANPANTVANEINPARAAALKSQGFAVQEKDAAEAKVQNRHYDVVIANPPFGAVKEENGESKVFDMGSIQPNYRTKEIDHAIALRSLEGMRDDGRGVLILGGLNKMLTSREARSDGYQAKAKREFYKVLYDNYNVVDHFTVSGDLYERQGAGWPVDVVVIHGRGKSARPLPAVDVPRIFNSWHALEGILDGLQPHAGYEGDAGREDVGAPVGGADAGSAVPDVGGGQPVGGQRVPGGRSKHDEPGSVQPRPVSDGRPGAVGGERDRDQIRSGGGGDTGGSGAAPASERRASGLDSATPPEWFSGLTEEGRRRLAQSAGMFQAEANRVAKMTWNSIPENIRSRLQSAVDNGAMDAIDDNSGHALSSRAPVDTAADPVAELQSSLPPGYTAGRSDFGHLRVEGPMGFGVETSSGNAARDIRTLVGEAKKHAKQQAAQEPQKDEFDEAFDSAFDDVYGPQTAAGGGGAKPPVSRPRAAQEDELEPRRQGKQGGGQRTAGEAASDAAKSAAEGADEAFTALYKLFGGDKASSGFTFDPETYAKAKPHFEKAARKFAESWGDLREFVKRMLEHMRDTLRWPGKIVEAMKPYLRRFVEEVRQGIIKLGSQAEEDRATGPQEQPKRAAPKQEQETESQVAYRPKSDVTGLGTLVPVNMRRSIADSLDALENRVGPIDDFVAKELGYKKTELEKYFGAEQVDALALAVDNIKRGKGFIIGDQTGIGKGRVNAAIIRYAIKIGRVPVFVTEKPNLYADMYRDMQDIGISDGFLDGEPRILATNSGLKLPLDQAGNVKIATGDGKSHNALLGGLTDPDALRKNYDMVFTNYSQMQTVKGEDTVRRQFLKRLANSADGIVVIFDESHNAGGQAVSRPSKDTPANRAEFARELVGLAKGVFYSSATYAKRPDVMDLYAATDMAMAVDDIGKLGEAIARGGVPMQQAVAAMLAKAGQYIRRERSFAGVSYDTPVVGVPREQYDHISRSLALIQDFSKTMKGAVEQINEDIKAEGEAVGYDGATGDAGASSTNFTAVMHNLINQMLLSMKARPAAEMALDALKRGEKPVLTVANTMESFLSDYADEIGITAGEAMPADFSDVLMKYLKRTRTVTIKKPFAKKGESERKYLTDEELGPIAVAAFREAADVISRLELSELPMSPIDYIKNALEKQGYKTGEITGRGTTIDYSGDEPILRNRPGPELSIRGRKKANDEFNNGTIDAILLNQAGSTGISLHSGEKFKDQRQRHMIIVQPEANIDTHMQMLGRVHRTGQIVVPKYSQLVADIPAEKRPAAVLAKKMASLNANTTASRGGAMTAKDVPDFINEYGDAVAVAYLNDNPEMNTRLADAVHFGEGGYERVDAMRKLTGRIPLLPLKEQEEVYEALESEYDALLKQMEASGENALEAKTLDLKAIPKEMTEVLPEKNNSGSPFAEPVYMVKASIARLGKPFTPNEVMAKVAEALGVGAPENLSDEEVFKKALQAAGFHGVASHPDEVEDAMRDPMGVLGADGARKVLDYVEGFKKGQSEQKPVSEMDIADLAKMLDDVNTPNGYNSKWGKVSAAIEDDSRKPVAADFADYRRRVTDDIADKDKAEKERNKLNAVFDRWSDIHKSLHIGKRIYLKTNGGNLTAIVLGVEQKGEPKNPVALGTWKATLAISDASRVLTLPFSRLYPDGKSPSDDPLSIEIADIPHWVEDAKGTLDRFAHMQNEAREDRYIATGNLLAAYDWLGMKGRIMHYTDAQGRIQQGVLTAKDFKLEKHAEGKGRPITDPNEIKTWLDANFNKTIFAKDNAVRLRKDYSGYTIFTEKSKKAGGVYYLDKPLTALTGDFYSRGGSMQAQVSESDIVTAIKRIMEIGAHFSGSAEKLKTVKVEPPAEESAAHAAPLGAITNTPAFKNWFGDSKVVDAGGKPLVVYHGTTETFDRFSLGKTGLRTGNKYGRGALFFTDNPRVASSYAAPPRHEPHPADRPNVVPAYLSLKNPIEIDAKDNSWTTVRNDVVRARRRGYDGAIIRNVIDHASAITAIEEGPIDVYVAFDPEQIKSAIGNSGAFDPANPDIAAHAQPSRGLTDEVEAIRQQIAAERRQVRAQVPGTPEWSERARQARLEQRLTEWLDHMTGGRFSKGEFGVIYSPKIDVEGQGAGYGDLDIGTSVGGLYTPAQRLVRVALSDAKFPNPFLSAVHEGTHIALDHFATDQERALLRSPAEQRRMAEYIAPRLGMTPGQAAQLSPFEVEAHAGQFYIEDRAMGGTGAGLHTGIRRLFERVLDFFRRLGNWLRGLGFSKWEDVIGKVASGEMGQRESRIVDPDRDSYILQDIRAENAERVKADESAAMAMPQPVEKAYGAVRDKVADLLGTDTAINLKEGLSDYSHRMRLLQDDVDSLWNQWVDPNGNLPDERQFYTLKRLFPGKRSNRIGDFNKAHYEPLSKLLRDNAITREQADEYLYARHAVERNREIGQSYEATHDFNKAIVNPDIVGASGMSANEARRIRAQYERGPKAAAFAGLVRQVREINRAIQEEMVRSGLESQQTIAGWNRAYSDYVPLQGWEDPEDTPENVDGARGRGRGRDVRGREVKQAFGRRSKADSPLANLIAQAYRTYERAEQNRVLVSLAGALSQLSRDMRRAGANTTMTDELGVRLNKGRPEKRLNKATGLVEIVPSSMDHFGDNAVKFKIGGEPRYMVFDDARIAQAIKTWAPGKLPAPLAWVQWVTNKMKSMWTHYSPTFIARHNARYFVEGLLNSFELKETGAHSARQYMKEGFPIVGEATRAIFARERGEQAGDLGRSWDLLKKHGGNVSMMAMRDIEKLKQDLRVKTNDLGKPQADPGRAFHQMTESLNSVTSVLDNAQRLAAFHQALQQGMSPQEAAVKYGRDATVDYGMRGLWSNWLGLFQPFFNTALRTGDRMFAAGQRSHIMRRVFLGTMMAGLVASAWNYLVGGKDKDGVPFFDKLPPWERANSLILMNPFITDAKGRPGIIKFPFPYNWAAPLSTGYAMGNLMWGSEHVGDVIRDLIFKPWLSTFTQVGETGIGVHSIIPEMLQPEYDVATNTNWMGYPVHQDKAFQKGPNAYAGRKPLGGRVRTGEGWKDIAQFLNWASGGDRGHSGYLDFYPEDIREIAAPFIGTQLQFGTGLYQAGASIANGQAPDASKTPIAKVFTGTDYDAHDRAVAGERYYHSKHPWERQ